MSGRGVPVSDFLLWRADSMGPDGLDSFETKVDHVITDLPYGESTIAGARKRSKFQQEQLSEAFISYDAFTLAQSRRAIELCGKVTRRWVIASMEWTHAADMAVNPIPGLRFIRCGVLVKRDSSPQFSGDRPAMGWEAVAIFHSEDERPSWNGGGQKAVWTHNVERNNGHPTPKPLEFAEQLVRLFTERGETVCDPFAGSCTTGVACIRLGREFIGFEIDRTFHAVGESRLRAAREQLGLFAEGA